MDASEKLTFNDVPLRVLNLSTRTKLGLMLNMPMDIPTREGYLKDWRGLAELARFRNDEIDRFRRCPRPTDELLSVWQNRANGTIDCLVEFLEKIGRFDVIDDLVECFRKDADGYTEQDDSQHAHSSQVVQVFNDSNGIKRHAITKDDLKLLGKNEIQRYDAYVCYSDVDFEFVKIVSSFLEVEHGFKLCIKDRDLLGGVIEYQATMELIEQRCDKLLVILSPAFLEDATLEYQAMCTYAMSVENRIRKLVPIIYKRCELPSMIRALAKLDYNSQTFNFWQRLFDAVQKTPAQTTSLTSLRISGTAFAESDDNVSPSTTYSNASTVHSSGSAVTPPIISVNDVEVGVSGLDRIISTSDRMQINTEVHSDENNSPVNNIKLSYSHSDPNLTTKKPKAPRTPWRVFKDFVKKREKSSKILAQSISHE